MKNIAKILCLLLALLLVVPALAACGKRTRKVTTVDINLDDELNLEDPDADAYTLASRKVYRDTLGEFYTYYLEAKGQDNTSTRFALMAIAEAKLLEAGVMVPTTTKGGTYSISRVAPKTATTVLWGTDSDRFHNRVIATEPIKPADREALIAKWNELKGTGKYEAAAAAYLTEKGYTLKNTHELAYSEDPQTWDALATSYASDSEAIVNTVDGLLEYDSENVQKPALATGYTVSKDGLTYTFKIRKGVKWVDSQGNEIATLTANDFVAGFQHMLDAPDGLGWLVDGVVKGVHAYLEGETTDFSTVGVQAKDDYTLVYTLEEPTSFFITMFAYSCFSPLCKSYYEAHGGVFGITEYEAAVESESYTYGKDASHIAYCGPYLVKNATEKNTIVFEQNPSYWNKNNVRITKITWYYNDGSDATKAYNDMKNGTIDGTGLNTSSLTLAKQEGWYDLYHYVSDTDATSYMAFFNINRTAFANANSGDMASPMTESQRTASAKAMTNRHFRLALAYAFDRASYNAQSVGDDLKYTSLRNSYTPGNYVTLEDAVEIEIGGEMKSYPAGTYYGQIMQDQLDADNFPVKVWDAEKGTGDGYDAWYNVERAVAELQTAIAELAAEGITISADNPIYIDYDYQAGRETSENGAQSFKSSIETALGGLVKVNLIGGDRTAFLAATYRFTSGSTANYSVNTNSGWGPDYGDPQTYLDTFLPEYEGYMTKSIGIY